MHRLLYHSGVDFDDAEFGFKEEDKEANKVDLYASVYKINAYDMGTGRERGSTKEAM